MILFLHNRYRTTGGEERVVADLLALVRERLGEPAELFARDSADLGRRRAAAGLLAGGLAPAEVAQAVRLTRARVVHAHNLHPAFGWRALAAARDAGARVVLHLHQYRLVCAIGVCFTRGAECTRCHGRDTSPGVRLNCRGSTAESVAYALSLSVWQRRLVEQADAVVVPSAFARERLRELGAPLPWDRVHVLAPPVDVAEDAPPPAGGEGAPGGPAGTLAGPAGALAGPAGALAGPARPPEGPANSPQGHAGAAGRPYALVVSRLAAEKGVDVSIDACRLAGIGLVIAGDGPEGPALRARAAAATPAASGPAAHFVGEVGAEELARLRAGAAIALAPSRSAETFGLAVAEAMAAGLPVAASRVGALPELLDEDSLVAPGDAAALASAISRLASDRDAGARGRRRIAALCAPARVAAGLAAIYDGV